MELDRWWPWYRWIAEKLGLDEAEDQSATEKLSCLLQGRALAPRTLTPRLKGRTALIFGAGPSLECDLEAVVSSGLHERCTIIAADGATAALLWAGVKPDLVLTDLDGSMPHILEAKRRGAQVAIHAHGDNQPALQTYVPKFEGRVLGTTQVKPVEGVYNFGGFTDGDRCAFLAEEKGAARIVLAGMDLGNKVGKYSKLGVKRSLEASAFKRMKLEIAGRLLEWLATWSRAEMFNLTKAGKPIRGFRKITCQQLEE